MFYDDGANQQQCRYDDKHQLTAQRVLVVVVFVTMLVVVLM
jgi:hypothetical protein